MKKIMFLLLLSVASLYAQSVSFTEGKYVEALDLYTNRDGNVSYDENQTVIAYEDGKRIVKVNNIVNVYDKKDELLTSIDLLEKPDVGLYFSLTKALFQKDFESLKESFEIKEQKEKVYLFTPKGDVEKIIKNIELFLKEDAVVSSFVLSFTNGDKIKIEAK